ncbi:MAG: serine hydrolase [Paracoccaceae bacterium]|nr:serine hydrolase [Paracoccaceae bacterium]
MIHWAIIQAGKQASSHVDVAPWWSLTKTAIAVAALRLARDGLIDLDTPISRGGSLRMLLSHQGGVANYTALPAYAEAVGRGDVPWSMQIMLTRTQKFKPPFQPNTGWAYSNTGYAIVRCALEAATNQTLAEILFRYVFDPIGLRETKLVASVHELDVCPLAVGQYYDPRWVYHGLVVGPSKEAALFVHALMVGDILEPLDFKSMMTIHDLGGAIQGRPFTKCGYGLGVMAGEMGAAGRVFGHSGVGPFSVSATYYFADLSMPTTVCVYKTGCYEGPAEQQALEIAVNSQ